MRIGRRVGYCWWVFLEWKLADMWVGVSWQGHWACYHLLDVGDIKREMHVYICLLPCVPIHVIVPLKEKP